MRDVTRILIAIEQGDARAADELLPAVYQELRHLAAQKLSQQHAFGVATLVKLSARELSLNS